jgi:hypothetical protein
VKCLIKTTQDGKMEEKAKNKKWAKIVKPLVLLMNVNKKQDTE